MIARVKKMRSSFRCAFLCLSMKSYSHQINFSYTLRIQLALVLALSIKIQISTGFAVYKFAYSSLNNQIPIIPISTSTASFGVQLLKYCQPTECPLNAAGTDWMLQMPIQRLKLRRRRFNGSGHFCTKFCAQTTFFGTGVYGYPPPTHSTVNFE